MANVRLYYLGGLERQPRPGKSNEVRVTAGQNVFVLPAPGEFIEVPAHVAEELMRKHKYITPQGDYSSFTKDKRLADRVKGGETALQAYQARTVLNLENMSDDALLAEVQRRKLSAEPEDESPKTKAKPAAAPVKKQPVREPTEDEVRMVNEMKKDDPDDDFIDDPLDLTGIGSIAPEPEHQKVDPPTGKKGSK